MAKRRRLEVPSTAPVLETKAAGRPGGMPPIAEVAGQAAEMAAAQSLVADVEAARAEGRLAIRVPIKAVEIDYLVRDRLTLDAEDLAELICSIRDHGQRVPIELVPLEGGRYGLISGYRRITAIEALYRQTKDAAWAEVIAIIRPPQEAGMAYTAMVEENEIRTGLSYYERARIAVLATEKGAFADRRAAVNALYASASKAKRSKIRAFIDIHDALGGALRYPTALSERLGLKLAAGLKEGLGEALLGALKDSAASPEAEAARLTAALAQPAAKSAAAKKTRHQITPDLLLEVSETGRGARRMMITGPAVTPEVIAAVRAALEDDGPA